MQTSRTRQLETGAWQAQQARLPARQLANRQAQCLPDTVAYATETQGRGRGATASSEKGRLPGWNCPLARQTHCNQHTDCKSLESNVRPNIDRHAGTLRRAHGASAQRKINRSLAQDATTTSMQCARLWQTACTRHKHTQLATGNAVQQRHPASDAQQLCRSLRKRARVKIGSEPSRTCLCRALNTTTWPTTQQQLQGTSKQ
jgi:hypothetical protein